MPRPRRVRPLWIALLCAALGLWAHRDVLGFGLLGFDTFFQISASRIESASDFLGTFTEELGDGQIPASFYRPVQNLGLAFDHAVGGLEPRGYQVHTMAAFALAVVALVLAASRLLGGGRIGPLACGLVFALHPALVNALPAPCRRSEVVVVACLALALWVLPQPGSRRPRTRAVLAAVLVLLAAGAKDIGVMGLGLVFAHQLLFSERRGLVASTRFAAQRALPTLVAALLYLVPRTLVLGGLGGYHELTGSAWDKTVEFGGTLVTDVFYPGKVLKQTLLPAGWERADVGLVVALTFGALALGCLILARCSHRRAGRPFVATLVLGLAWIVPPVAVLGRTEWYSPWYAVFLLPGLGLMLAAVVQAAIEALDDETLLRAFAAVQLVFVLALAACVLYWSPLFADYPEWRNADRNLRATLGEVDEQMAVAELGDSIRVTVTPYANGPRSKRRPQMNWAASIQHLGVEAYARLKYPALAPLWAENEALVSPETAREHVLIFTVYKGRVRGSREAVR